MEKGKTLSELMAEIIHLRAILQARRRQREQEYLHRCVEAIEQSLQCQVEEFSQAPAEEWPIRASKIRKLGELLEYATSLL
jgi:hypothetical protein